MDMDGREYRTIGRDFEYLSAWHTHIYSHKDTYSSWHALEWKIPLAFWGFPSGIPRPPPFPRPTSLVGGTYLIMCVIEKGATAVKEHTHASRKSCCVRKIKP